MQIARLMLMIAFLFCIQGCNSWQTFLQPPTNEISNSETEKNKSVIEVSNEESNSKPTDNKKGDENSPTEKPSEANETEEEHSKTKPEPDVCVAKGKPQSFNKLIVQNQGTVQDKGERCFKWKIEGYYGNDNVYSYSELTFFIETEQKAKNLKGYLEGVIKKEKKAKGTVTVNKNLVVIHQFNADTFALVIQAREKRNEILDTVLTRCSECKSKQATAQ